MAGRPRSGAAASHRWIPRWIVLTCHAAVGWAALAGQPPVIQRLVPPGGELGTDVEVTLVGKPGEDPLRVWSDRDQVQVVVTDDRTRATITIPPQSEPGIHYLRFYNEHGAAELRPFFVGPFREQSETEPNNRPRDACAVESVPVTINGVLEKSGEVDVFAVPLEAGQAVTCAVQANRALGSPMDGVLELLNPAGTRIATCDDDQGNDPRISIVPPASGIYFVRLFAFPASPNSTIGLAGGQEYQYRLTIGPAGFEQTDLDSLAELHETDAADRTLSIPWTAHGVIGEPGERDQFGFEASAGDNLTIRVAARRHGALLDPVAVLYDPDGKTIKEFDDISRSDPDVEFAVTLTAGGTHALAIRDRFDHGGQRYYYVASVEANLPSFDATVAANAFVVGTEKPLEIPVSIVRRNGFAEEITVEIDGLPSGLTAEPMVSVATGDTANTVTLKVSRDPEAGAFAGTVQIICRCQEEQRATAPIPNTSQTTSQLWLTVTPP